MPPRFWRGPQCREKRLGADPIRFPCWRHCEGACAPRLLPEEAHQLQQAVVGAVNGRGVERDCSEHAQGMFLVLGFASDRSLRSRPDLAVAKSVEQGSVHRSLSANKKGPRKEGRFYWRTERDSNPRTAFTVTHFPGVRLQPLGHLSALEWGKYTVGPVPASYLKIKGFWPETGLLPGLSLALRAFAARNGPPDHFVRAGRANHSSQARPSSCDKRLFGL